MSKVLIVDDDKNIVIALSVRLKAEGYDVVCAYDGMMATSVAVREQPDVVLMDISMPAGDGLSVLKRLRAMAPLACVPIIIMTASKKAGLREASLNGGAAAFVEKPFQTQEITMLLQAVLQGQDS